MTPRSYSRATLTAAKRNSSSEDERRRRRRSGRRHHVHSARVLLGRVRRRILRRARGPPRRASTRDVLAGHERLAVGAARAPELAVDEDEPVAAHDAPRRRRACATPTATGDRAAPATTFVSAKPSRSASVPAIASATGSDTWYASPAGSKSISAPITNVIAPASASAPCVDDERLGDEEAGGEQHQQQPGRARPAAPGARRGRGSARSRRPCPGRSRPGFQSSTTIPISPIESMSAMMFGSISEVEEPLPEATSRRRRSRRPAVSSDEPFGTVFVPSISSSSAGSVGRDDVDDVHLAAPRARRRFDASRDHRRAPRRRCGRARARARRCRRRRR